MKICKFCHAMIDEESDEIHECEQMLKIRRAQEKRHRDNAGDARKAINNRYWRQFRKEVILRDGGYCQRCFIKFHKYVFDNLEVHHITPRVERPDLAFDESNVITLCRDCNLEMGLDGIDFKWQPTTLTHEIHL